MNGHVLLTREQVEEWQRERDEIAEKRRQLDDRQALLDKKLEAASLFMDVPKAEAEPTHRRLVDLSTSNDGTPENGVTLVDAVTQVLREAGIPLSNKQIKRRLASTGYDVSRLNQSPNYYYTVTKRLVSKGIAEKRPDGSLVIKKAEAPEGRSNGLDPSEASTERRVDRPAESLPSGPVKPEAGGGT